jgi:hypothetical protein
MNWMICSVHFSQLMLGHVDIGLERRRGPLGVRPQAIHDDRAALGLLNRRRDRPASLLGVARDDIGSAAVRARADGEGDAVVPGMEHRLLHLDVSFEPPATGVTVMVGVPASADVPPHGPAFCGSPSRFSISHDGGSTSVKCASAVTGSTAAAATIPSHTRIAGVIARYLAPSN